LLPDILFWWNKDMEKLRSHAADVTDNTKAMHKKRYSSANANLYGSINVTRRATA